MALSKNAKKLQAWFEIYKTTATEYAATLDSKYKKAQRRGAFAEALAELVAFEAGEEVVEEEIIEEEPIIDEPIIEEEVEEEVEEVEEGETEEEIIEE
jgi:intergrase/recombinase